MAADDAQEPQKKKSGMFKWLVIILLLMILAVGGFIAYKMFLSSPSDPATASEDMAPADSQEDQPANEPGVSRQPEDIIVVTLPTFLVNLRDPLGRRYLKLTMEVRVANEETSQLIDRYQSVIVDAIIMTLSSKTYAEISTLESKRNLKKELLTEINRILPSPDAIDIFFLELVIQ